MIEPVYLTAHFRESEFKCRCRRPDCDAPAMDTAFMTLLEQLRVWADIPLPITSGARCAFWNATPEVGGAPNSQHLYGRAADLWLPTHEIVKSVAAMADKIGFGGIGTGCFHLLHVDTGPAGRRWVYQTK